MSCGGLCCERIAPEHLLRGGYTLWSSLAKERNAPIGKDGKSILEASQRGEVDDKPKQPSRKTGNAQRTDRSDCTQARDRSHGPAIAVPKWSARIVALHPSNDGPRGVTAGLNGNLRYAGQVIEAHQVTNHENFRVVWQRAIGFDFDPTCAIKLGARTFRD